MSRLCIFLFILDLFIVISASCKCSTAADGKISLLCQYEIITRDQDYGDCPGAEEISLIRIFDENFGNRNFLSLFPAARSLRFRFERPMCVEYCRSPLSPPPPITIDVNCVCDITSRTAFSSSPPPYINQRPDSPHDPQSAGHRLRPVVTKPPFLSSVAYTPPTDHPPSPDHESIGAISAYIGSSLAVFLVLFILTLVRHRLAARFPRFTQLLDALVVCVLRKPTEHFHNHARQTAVLEQALNVAECNFRAELSLHADTNRQLAASQRESRLLQVELEQLNFDSFLTSSIGTKDQQTTIAATLPILPVTTAASSDSPSEPARSTAGHPPTGAAATPAEPSTESKPSGELDAPAAQQPVITLSLLQIERALQHLMDDKSRVRARTLVTHYLLEKGFSFEQMYSSPDHYLLTKFRLHYATDLTPGEYASLSSTFSITLDDMKAILKQKDHYLASRAQRE